MKQVKLSVLLILGVFGFAGLLFAAASSDGNGTVFDKQTDAINVLTFGRAALPTGAGPAEVAPTDIPRPDLDPRVDLAGAAGGGAATPVLLPFSADYNLNGVVDAADYTLWRDQLGQTGPALASDGNHDGVVDNSDYDLWRSHFGNPS